MSNTLQNLMREATRLTQSGHLKEATRVIQDALGNVAHQSKPTAPTTLPPPFEPPQSAASSIILDGCVFEVDPSKNSRYTNPQGEFTEGSHTHASLTRRYKLYAAPSSIDAGADDHVERSRSLVVMLHGCTQNADDFAAGTAMNALARQRGVYVLYPEQSATANPQRCWNWFKHNHQSRGRGEAALLASMTLAVMRQHGIDPRRVYIAGLSAGGAMAAIVAAAYPEVFAAVGVHSGLAVGAASNVAQALAAMNNGAADITVASATSALPTIVFHGDQDRTVHPRNGEQLMEALGASAGARVEQGVSKQGQTFSKTCHQRNDVNFAELWVLHSAGHAWSGGSAKGSYTDPKGPDASAEMLRFFAEHVKPG